MSHKRTTPRHHMVLRLEPPLLQAIDASPGVNRHAKIVRILEGHVNAREPQRLKYDDYAFDNATSPPKEWSD